jgi:hypothetical protein
VARRAFRAGLTGTLTKRPGNDAWYAIAWDYLAGYLAGGVGVSNPPPVASAGFVPSVSIGSNAARLVQSVESTAPASATSISATFLALPVSGNLLIATAGLDKQAGTITGPSGFTEIANNAAVALGIWFGYKVSDGTETSITVSRSTASVSGDGMWIAEYAQDGSGAWQIVGSATHYTDDSAVKDWSSGTTSATTGPGRALSVSVIDTATNAATESWSNSYVELKEWTVGGGGADVAIAYLDVPVGTSAETTHTHTGTADQISGAIAVFSRSASGADISASAISATTAVTSATVSTPSGAVIAPAVMAATFAPASSESAGSSSSAGAIPLVSSVPGASVSTAALVSFGSYADAADYNNGSITISKPSGTASGDLLVATIVRFEDSGNQASAFTAPSGWTEKDSTVNYDYHTKVFYKYAGGSEPSSYAFTYGATSDGYGANGAITRVTGGPSSGDPFDVAPTYAAGNSASSTITAPTITIVNGGALAIFSWLFQEGFTDRTVTGPGGGVTLYGTYPDVGGLADLESGYKTIPSAGATGSQVATLSSGTVDINVGMSFAIKPGGSSASISPGATGAATSAPGAGLATGASASPGSTGAVTSAPVAVASASTALSPGASGAVTLVPAPLESAGAGTSPGVVGAVASAPASGVSTGARTSPGAIGAVTSAPALALSTGAGASPGAAGAATAAPAAGVSTGTGSAVSPEVIGAVASAPTPALSAGSRTSPGATGATVAAPVAALSAGAGTSPGATGAATSVPVAGVAATGTASVAAGTVAGTAAVPAGVIHGGAGASAPVIGAVGAVSALSLTAGATVVSIPVSIVSAVSAPVITGAAEVAPPPALAIASGPSGVVSAGATSAASAVAAPGAVPGPDPRAGSTVAATALPSLSGAPVPAPGASATMSPTATAIAADVSAPGLGAGASAPAPALGALTSVILSVISTGGGCDIFASPIVGHGSVSDPSLTVDIIVVPDAIALAAGVSTVRVRIPSRGIARIMPASGASAGITSGNESTARIMEV